MDWVAHFLTVLSHFSLGVVILVAHKYPIDHLTVLVDLVEPPLNVGEALAAGDVIHHNHAVCPPVVGAGDRPEPLLTRRVPDLQLHFLPVKLYCANLEVDTCNEWENISGINFSTLLWSCTYRRNVVSTEVVVCKSHQ